MQEEKMAKKKDKEQQESEIKIEDISSEAEPEDQTGEASGDQGQDNREGAGDTKAGSSAGQGSDGNARSDGDAGSDGSGDQNPDGPDSKSSEEDESWNEKYTRLMADFQNFRKRTEKEKADVYSFANERIMTDLLQVMDNFERALGSECQDQAYAEGMQMIFKQFTDILKNSGLEEIEAVGHDFDPNFHHAVLTDSNPDFDSGKVTEVLQKGYKLNGKVIRPSMVKVNE